MIIGLKILALGAVLFALSGCLVSDKALIVESDAVTPIAPGTYIDEKKPGDKTAMRVVTLSGHETRIAEGTDAKPDAFLVRNLRGDLFIIMSRKSSEYGVIAINANAIIEYKSGGNCDSLVYLAARRDMRMSQMGVVRVDDEGESAKCVFDDYAKLAAAFLTLYDNGKMVPGTTYIRVKGSAKGK